MKLANFLFCAAAFSLLAADTLRAEASISDTIVRRNGLRTERIVVTDDEYTKVKYHVVGSKKITGEFKAEDVHLVIYGDEPIPYSGARNFLERKEYQKARAKFRQAAGHKNTRAWLQVHCLFGQGECERLQKRYQDAIGYYQQAISKYDKSRLAPDCINGLAQCYIGLGGKNFTKAWESYGQLAGGEYGERWKTRATFGRAVVRESEGMAFVKVGDVARATPKLAGALQLFDTFITELSTEEMQADNLNKELLFRSKTHKGKILNAQGQSDAAVEWFSKLIKESQNAENGAAEAFNGRADSFYQAGKYRRALWDYMRVSVVYFYEADQHKHALSRSVSCFNQVGDEKKAREYSITLKKQYPDVTVEVAAVVKKETQPKPEVKEQKKETPKPAAKQVVFIKKTTSVYVDQKVAAQLKQGETYDYLGAQGEWIGLALKDGRKGWIPKKDCEIKEFKPPPENAIGTAVITVDGAKVFEEGNEVAQVKKGETFFVIDKDEGWFGIQLEVNGKKTTGWVSAKEVKFQKK